MVRFYNAWVSQKGLTLIRLIGTLMTYCIKKDCTSGHILTIKTVNKWLSSGQILWSSFQRIFKLGTYNIKIFNFALQGMNVATHLKTNYAQFQSAFWG